MTNQIMQDWQELRHQAQTDVLSYMALMRPETKFGPQHFLFRDVIADLAARRKRFVCLSCPPRHSKSYTFSQALPAWWLGNSPKDQIIATSYAASLAQSNGGLVRADMASDLFGKVFSTLSQPAGVSSSGTDFRTNAGGKYKATGVSGSLTGFGGDLIVVDDPIKNAETADSPRYKDMLEKFFGETLYTRLMPNGVIVVMMTRWREDDLVGYILRNFSDWEYINVPALADEDDIATCAQGLLGRSLGDPLWPEFFTAADLNRTRKILGDSAFQALYQGRPVSAKGGTLSASDLLYAQELGGVAANGSLDLPVWRFWSWDLALTKEQKSDYTVGQYWTVYSSGKLHMTDYVRERGNFVEVLQLIQGCQTRLPGDLAVIEHSHMGLAIRDQLAQDCPELKTVLHKPVGKKLDRLQRCLPKWRDRLVWIQQHPDRLDFADCIDELVKAGLTTHDDFLDAATQAIEYASTSLVSKSNDSLAFASSNRQTVANSNSGYGELGQANGKTTASYRRSKQFSWR